MEDVFFSGEFWESATSPEVQAELANGADVQARTEDGWTPLHKAVRYSKAPKVVMTLLDAGADPKAKTNDGKTAFDLMQENKKLKGTDAYWRLNDMQYD